MLHWGQNGPKIHSKGSLFRTFFVFFLFQKVLVRMVIFLTPKMITKLNSLYSEGSQYPKDRYCQHFLYQNLYSEPSFPNCFFFRKGHIPKGHYFQSRNIQTRYFRITTFLNNDPAEQLHFRIIKCRKNDHLEQ